MILRARVVLPVSRPPVENGAVIVSGNRIRSVGSWQDLRARSTGEIVDLGEVILLPGLVNAHCHLDYTDMAGLLPPPKTFTDWIHLMISAKAQWGYAEYARSWLNGARMLLQTGTTTVADIEAVPDLLPEVWDGGFCPTEGTDKLATVITHPRIKQRRILIIRNYGTTTVSPACKRMFCSEFLPLITSL